MKLRGSIIEQKLRDELIASHDSLFKSSEDKKILSCLMKQYPDMVTAYLLHWICEQGEDIYHYLIDLGKVCIIEVSRVETDLDPIVEDYPLNLYKKELNRTDRIRFFIAQELAKSDIHTNHLSKPLSSKVE